MKKSGKQFHVAALLCAGILCTGAFAPAFPIKQANAEGWATEEEADKYMKILGKTVDIMTQGYGDSKDRSIFSEGFLEYLKPGIHTNNAGSYTEVYATDHSYESLVNLIQSMYNVNIYDFGEGIYPFLAEAEFVGKNASTSLDIMIYYAYKCKEYFVATFDGDFDLNIGRYEGDAFHADFLQLLDKIRAKESDYTDIFDYYGTHAISSAKFGWSDISYTMAFTEKGWTEEEKEITMRYLPLAGKNLQDMYEQAAKDGVTLPANFSTHNYVRGQRPEENSNLTEAVAPIGFTPSSLTPLYDLLPEEYADMREPMKEAFIAYAKEHSVIYTTKPAPTEDTDSGSDSQNVSPENGNSDSGCSSVAFAGGLLVLPAALFFLFKRRK